MDIKTDTQVLIGGKVFKLSGYESEEYMQKVASYLNGKLEECESTEGFKRLPYDRQNILVQLNIADDYFKARKQVESLEKSVTDKDKELYDIKHELVTSQIKNENLTKNIGELNDKLNDAQRRIIELETRLSTVR